ncbi:MAG: GNAT family N-acetyltransferase [Candidatus Izemoplasmataceae bacterium]
MKLVQVNRKYKNMIQDYKDEYLKYDDEVNGGCGIHHYTNLDDWFDEIDKIVLGKSTIRIQSSTYMCIVDEKMVGIIDIRHHLPDEWYTAGHIGYSVRPSERKKGYAPKALREALKIAKKLEINPTLVTCLKSNIISQKVIIKNGGVLIDEVIEDDGETLIFRIDQ